MNKKLTLSLDDIIIERAKVFARDHKESLSYLVENYFRFITSETKIEKKKTAPLIEELLGSVKVPENYDYDDVKYQYLAEKYLND